VLEEMTFPKQTVSGKPLTDFMDFVLKGLQSKNKPTEPDMYMAEF